jgi:hypothetical protein
MVEQITFQTIFQFLQTLGILVGVFYYIITIRTNQKNQELQLETRQAQLFMSLYQNHVSKENLSDWIEMVQMWEWDDMDDFNEKYRVPSSLENQSKYLSYTNKLEGWGVLVRRGLIDINLLYDLSYASIILFWEKFSPRVIETRRRRNAPHFYENIEYLYDEMIRIRAERIHSEIIAHERELSPEQTRKSLYTSNNH